MKATQKSILPEREMLLKLTRTSERIRSSRAEAVKPVQLPTTLRESAGRLQVSIAGLDAAVAKERLQTISTSQSFLRRFLDDRYRRKVSREVVSKMRWLEDLIVRSAGTGPSSDGARARLKELDGDTRFFNVLQAQSKIVGLGTEVGSLLTRVYEAIDQASPRQEQKDALTRDHAFLEQVSAIENDRASIGI